MFCGLVVKLKSHFSPQNDAFMVTFQNFSLCEVASHSFHVGGIKGWRNFISFFQQNICEIIFKKLLDLISTALFVVSS